jgi:hypothetical protein
VQIHADGCITDAQVNAAKSDVAGYRIPPHRLAPSVNVCLDLEASIARHRVISAGSALDVCYSPREASRTTTLKSYR